ncbi:helix-turn-helix transcriptional regulator [Brevibacillus sp. 179-C 1.1 NHS]|uniref:helix-turn-helix transcriptional regulator n=1 Tax=Brevibacillus sp. 179-C 1.1 NHS TaxID=3235177 RepID=UPI0039A20B11
MNRTGRLLELLALLHTGKTFTVGELADTLAVSKRTMLRDLHLLSESGAPLQASPGPGGGYRLIRSHQLAPLALTTEEAIALILSYGALLSYTDKPFEHENLSVIAKLLASLPTDALARVDALRKKIRVTNPSRSVETPFLRPLLEAALSQQAVEIAYDSLTRKSTRIIWPDYLYAFDGYWYCKCFCFLRQCIVKLRVDRIQAMTIVESPSAILDPNTEQDEELELLPLRIHLTRKGCKLAESHHQFGNQITLQPDGSGLITDTLAPSELDWVARFVLGLGREATVDEPAQLIVYLRKEIDALFHVYPVSVRSTR